MVGGGMSPVQAACAFALAGISYSISTEHMLRIVGSVRGNLIGMMISAIMYDMSVIFAHYYVDLSWYHIRHSILHCLLYLRGSSWQCCHLIVPRPELMV